MIIKTTPENFDGCRGGAFFEIEEAEPTHIIEAFIEGADSTVYGVKKLSGESRYRINVGHYIEDRMDVIPLYMTSCEFMAHPKKSIQVRLNAKIGRWNGVNYPPVTSKWVSLTAGREEAIENTILSNSPAETEALPNGHDEIAFISPGNEVCAIVTINTDQSKREFRLSNGAGAKSVDDRWFECGDSLTVLHINIGQLIGDAEEEVIGIRLDLLRKTIDHPEGEVFGSKYYKILPESDLFASLYWINEYGAIDYYLFERYNESIESTTNCHKPDRKYKLVSRTEPRNRVEWLAEIGISPKVWLFEEGQFEEVDLESINTVVFDRTEPVPITVSIKKK